MFLKIIKKNFPTLSMLFSYDGRVVFYMAVNMGKFFLIFLCVAVPYICFEE